MPIAENIQINMLQAWFSRSSPSSMMAHATIEVWAKFPGSGEEGTHFTRGRGPLDFQNWRIVHRRAVAVDPLDWSGPIQPRCATLDNYSVLEIVLDLEPRTPGFYPLVPLPVCCVLELIHLPPLSLTLLIVQMTILPCMPLRGARKPRGGNVFFKVNYNALKNLLLISICPSRSTLYPFFTGLMPWEINLYGHQQAPMTSGWVYPDRRWEGRSRYLFPLVPPSQITMDWLHPSTDNYSSCRVLHSI